MSGYCPSRLVPGTTLHLRPHRSCIFLSHQVSVPHVGRLCQTPAQSILAVITNDIVIYDDEDMRTQEVKERVADAKRRISGEAPSSRN